ncbi:MAG TPA: serine/threonine-protein kinase [Thermoanaerobaculia bacterium]|nr:serine/threonine-protein kinase [Thermoanaerobaculia bacterium]
MTLRFGFGLEEIELGEMVGRGGSGEVFAARHRETGARLAAKIYPFDRMDPAFRPRERFQRECRILSRMEHPAFPALYGCGEEDDGSTGWALMEWIEGEPLSAYRSAPVHEVVRLAYGIASALDALHVQGILHRDIAFDNVLVEKRRFGNNPRLIDLGVAKDISSNEDLTMAGAFLGRVPFASPELLTEEGAAGLVDPRSDVFSFGVLLFEWLSGKPPFPGETPDRVMKAQKKRATPKLELREDAGEADGTLPAFVESLLETEIEKRPSSDAVVRWLGELRRLHPRPVLDLSALPTSIYSVASLGYALLPRRFEAAPSLRRLRAVSFPEPQPRPAAAAGPREGPSPVPALPGIGSRPGFGGLVLALGILAFLAACALAAFLLFKH